MKKIITLLLALGLLSVNLPAMAETAEADALISQSVTGVDWNKNLNTYGVWSFYATAGYWDKGTGSVPAITAEGVVTDEKTFTGSGIIYNTYKYGDLSNEGYCTPVQSSWLDSTHVAEGWDDISHNGIRFGLENESKSLLLIKPNAYDNRVRFWLDVPQNTESKKGDIIVCFTAPEDGVYNILHELYDEETDGTKTGDGGIVRRTILCDGETMESAQNSEDYEFSKDAPSKENKKVTLSAGDRVYIRVSAGATAQNDNFYGKVILDRYASDNDTEIIETYDLSKVAMSTAGNWSFMNSLWDNTDYTQYHHMFAYERNNGNAEAYSSSFNGRKYTVTATAGVNKTPSVKWSLSGEGEVMLKSGGSSGTFLKRANPLLVWTAPKDGLYSLDLGLSDASATEGSTITVSLLKNGEKNDTNIIKTVTFDGEALTTEELSEIGCSLKKDDKLIIRFAKASGTTQAANAEFTAKPSIRKLMENFEASYFKVSEETETKIDNLSAVQAGDVVRVVLKGDNILSEETAMQAYTSIYEGGKLVATYPAESILVGAYSPAEITIECTIPEGVTAPEFATFVWTDFNKAAPLCNEIYFQ
ncbi:MAG: hypothetical protein E7397_03120 [Ruminococcaceae bacterium]|nr:hypothetical protein [Oscillospiraceae bacterium]